MLTQAFAQHFADEWIAAWNAHDLAQILSHYDEQFEMASPFIASLYGEPSGKLLGKPAVAAYWAKALQMMPTLHFELIQVLLGADSLTLYYMGARGLAAEVFFFNLEGKVVKAFGHYA